MVKTDTHNGLTGQTHASATRANETREGRRQEQSGPDAARNDEPREHNAPEETLDVERAREVYGVTQQAAREPASSPIESAKEAAARAEHVAGQLRGNPEQALGAQTGQLSRHLADLL